MGDTKIVFNSPTQQSITEAVGVLQDTAVEIGNAVKKCLLFEDVT